jgi:hypothetical protein
VFSGWGLHWCRRPTFVHPTLGASHADPFQAQSTFPGPRGIVASDWTMQRARQHSWRAGRPATIMESTALGAAYLAGLQSGPLSGFTGVRSALGARPPLPAVMDETTRSPPGSTPSAARWAAMTLRARHRMPAVHFIGGLMRAGRRTYVSVGAVGDTPFCSGALSSPSVER